jgi:hypothetical protein
VQTHVLPFSLLGCYMYIWVCIHIHIHKHTHTQAHKHTHIIEMGRKIHGKNYGLYCVPQNSRLKS